MKKDEPFVMMLECHMYHDLTHIDYYPGVRTWFNSVTGSGLPKLVGIRPEDIHQVPLADELIRDMDRCGVDMASCLRESMMDTTGFATSMSTNGQIAAEVAKYPDRLIFEANCGPVLKRGVENAIWEMEYVVKEMGAKLCKIYQPEDIGPINDPRMWPYYEKAQELGVPLSFHTGANWCGGQHGKNCLPIQLEDVLNDFPDLKVIAYHMGVPYHEQLFVLACRFPNLYMSVSFILGWWTQSPYRGYHMIGEAMQFCGGAQQIVLGMDWPFVNLKACIDYMRNLEMPDELVEKWGYKKITDEDRRLMLGLNLAKLLDIEPKKLVNTTPVPSLEEKKPR